MFTRGLFGAAVLLHCNGCPAPFGCSIPHLPVEVFRTSRTTPEALRNRISQSTVLEGETDVWVWRMAFPHKAGFLLVAPKYDLPGRRRANHSAALRTWDYDADIYTNEG